MTSCGYLEWTGNCAKDGKQCKYRYEYCPKLHAERKGMKQLREAEEK